jgi:protein phosphatase
MSSIPPITLSLPAAPKPRDDELDVFGLTHPGTVRRDNQDHFLLCTLHKQMHVWGTSLPATEPLPLRSERLAFVALVADGVGGAAAGEHASRATVAAIARYVSSTLTCFYAAEPSREEAFARQLEEAVGAAHTAVTELGRTEPAWHGLATTLTMAVGVWPRAYVVQVGDSRAYGFRHGTLTRITRDQTVAQELADAGVLRPSEAAQSPLANVLSSAIGGDTTKPVVTRLAAARFDAFLLCSDGLTKHVPDERIAERLRAGGAAEQTCNALLQDALDAGGTDNITILIGRVH